MNRIKLALTNYAVAAVEKYLLPTCHYRGCRTNAELPSIYCEDHSNLTNNHE